MTDRIAVAFRCPDAAEPSGGVRLIFRHARILNSIGIPARVAIPRARWVQTWLEEGKDLIVPECPTGAVSVVPETDRVGLELSGEKVYLAQSTFFRSTFDRGFNLRDHGVVQVLAVSENVRSAIEAHYGISAKVLHPSVDASMFKPAGKSPRSVAYMPRRNAAGIERILTKCRRSELALRSINGLKLDGVAEALGTASVFLAASHPEGFGLPGLEAMASGCIVVGFAGGGGLEYMRSGVNCLLAPDGDEAAAAELLCDAIELVASNNHLSMVSSAIRTAHMFSPEREAHEVSTFWRAFLTGICVA